MTIKEVSVNFRTKVMKFCNFILVIFIILWLMFSSPIVKPELMKVIPKIATMACMPLPFIYFFIEQLLICVHLCDHSNTVCDIQILLS